jgi:hypothetical protein
MNDTRTRNSFTRSKATNDHRHSLAVTGSSFTLTWNLTDSEYSLRVMPFHNKNKTQHKFCFNYSEEYPLHSDTSIHFVLACQPLLQGGAVRYEVAAAPATLVQMEGGAVAIETTPFPGSPSGRSPARP